MCRDTVFFPRAVMAMALSFWKMVRNTKMWRSVAPKIAKTVAEAMEERTMARILVIQDGVAWAYSVAAMAAPVIGNVYAHQDSVNLRGIGGEVDFESFSKLFQIEVEEWSDLMPRKKLMRTAREV